jgi:hypothetical protein
MNRLLPCLLLLSCEVSGVGDEEDTLPDGEDTLPEFAIETDLPGSSITSCLITGDTCAPTWRSGATYTFFFDSSGTNESTQIAWATEADLSQDRRQWGWTDVNWPHMETVSLSAPPPGRWFLAVRTRGGQFEPWHDCYYIVNYRDVLIEHGHGVRPPGAFEAAYGDGCADPPPEIPGFDPWYNLMVTSVESLDTDLPADSPVDTDPADTGMPVDTDETDLPVDTGR